MSLPSGHPPFTGGHHTVSFMMKGPEYGRRPREVDVHATPEEIRYLAAQGFLVRERLFAPDHLARLRAALDDLRLNHAAGRTVSFPS